MSYHQVSYIDLKFKIKRASKKAYKLNTHQLKKTKKGNPFFFYSHFLLKNVPPFLSFNQKKICQYSFFALLKLLTKITNLFFFFSLEFYKRRWSVGGLKGFNGDGRGGWLQEVGWLVAWEKKEGSDGQVG